MTTRAFGTGVCAVLVGLAGAVALAAQKPIYESEARTVTATIEAVEALPEA